MKTCGHCGAGNPSDAAFCDQCGKPITSRTTPPPPTEASITCPSCQASALPGHAYCGECGTSLSGVGAGPASFESVSQVAPPPTEPVRAAAAAENQAACPTCGNGIHAEDRFCENCGAAVDAGPTPQWASDISAPTPRPTVPPPVPPPIGRDDTPAVPASRSRLVVAGPHGGPIDLGGRSTVIVGRSDPVSNTFPEIDLGPLGAEELGISREHVRLICSPHGQWSIQDLDSVNHTWVNNRRLAPRVRVPLNNGDQLRLGRMVMSFHS